MGQNGRECNCVKGSCVCVHPEAPAQSAKKGKERRLRYRRESREEMKGGKMEWWFRAASDAIEALSVKHLKPIFQHPHWVLIHITTPTTDFHTPSLRFHWLTRPALVSYFTVLYRPIKVHGKLKVLSCDWYLIQCMHPNLSLTLHAFATAFRRLVVEHSWWFVTSLSTAHIAAAIKVSCITSISLAVYN